MNRYYRATVLLAAAVLAAGCGFFSQEQAGELPYLARRGAFTSDLLYHEPAPQSWEEEVPPPDVEEVYYESDELELKAWVYIPAERAERMPALIYFHGGFSFAAEDMEVCRPFMDAGYVVMFPMLRGENGNPGCFELFWGEVDDAGAAVNWLATQPYVDGERVYTFGHSVGGGISALLSLMEDVPVQHGGSSGGLYPPDVFEEWENYGIVPFDRKIAEEVELRLLLGNIHHMRRLHYAYIGEADTLAGVDVLVQQEMAGEESLLRVVLLAGDHFTSLDLAVERYLEIVEAAKEAG